jgi:hypothetical protein
MSSPEARYGSASDFDTATPLDARATGARRAALRRLALLLTCGCGAGAILLLGGEAGLRSADPDLATLLKGMAIIKTAILSAAAGAVWWRLGSPISSGLAAGYIVSTALAAAGSALVWTMTGLAFAPFLFDGGGLAPLPHPGAARRRRPVVSGALPVKIARPGNQRLTQTP